MSDSDYEFDEDDFFDENDPVYIFDETLQAYRDDIGDSLHLKSVKNPSKFVNVGSVFKIDTKVKDVDETKLNNLIKKINKPRKLKKKVELIKEIVQSDVERNTKKTIVVGEKYGKNSLQEIRIMYNSIRDEEDRIIKKMAKMKLKKMDTTEIRKLLKKIVNRRLKLQRTLNSFVPGCKNLVTTIGEEPVKEVETEGNLIKLENGICYDISELVNYIISRKGINTRGGPGKDKNKPIWNDTINELNYILTFKKGSTIHPEAKRLRDYFNNKNEIVNEIKKTFSDRDINLLEKTGQILISQGHYFETEIDKLPLNLKNEWNEKKAGMTTLEPPSNLSSQLSNEINNIKGVSISELNSGSLSTENIALLDRLSIALGDSTTYSRDISMCVRGEHCMMILGNKLLRLVRTIRNQTGGERRSGERRSGVRHGGQVLSKQQLESRLNRYTKKELLQFLKNSSHKNLNTKSKNELIKLLIKS